MEILTASAGDCSKAGHDIRFLDNIKTPGKLSRLHVCLALPRLHVHTNPRAFCLPIVTIKTEQKRVA